MKLSYPAVLYKQLKGASEQASVLIFAAPSADILSFAGIPRKEVVDASRGETVGYQRPPSDRKLPRFLNEPENIIPTSLLLATRNRQKVTFIANPNNSEPRVSLSGVVEIDVDFHHETSFQILLEELLTLLERRHPKLSEIHPDERLVARAKRALTDPDPAKDQSEQAGTQDAGEENLPDTDTDQEEEEGNEELGAVVFDQNAQIENFYVTAKSAHKALTEASNLENLNTILGFSKGMLLDYIRPTIVVDGQHRLLGAEETIKTKWETAQEQDPHIAARLANRESPEEVKAIFYKANDRLFGISLMVSDDWAEHVFQFITVNQKAKSINKSLLSSIISTSLTDQELNRIKPRLGSAGIKIEDLTIVGKMRLSGPFAGLVSAGFDTRSGVSETDKLDQSSLIKIFKIFRDLSGAKDPLLTDGDAAREWRSTFLSQYAHIQDYREKGFRTRLQYWSAANGPWLEIFNLFFTTIRDRISSESSANRRWGDVHESQLFNAATLSVLVIQFFNFLHTKEKNPENRTAFKQAIEEFTSRLNPEFFGEQWNLLPGRRIEKANLQLLHQYLRKLWNTNKGEIRSNLYEFLNRR